MSVLTDEHIAYLDFVAELASITQIEDIIIESGAALRAIDANRTIVLLSSKVPTFPVKSIGLTRLNMLLARLGIVRKMSGFEMSVVPDPSQTFALSLHLKSKSTKIDFRCARPDTIKAPKSLNDEYTSSFTFGPDLITLLTNGQRAMKADVVGFEATPKGEVCCEIKDVNGDALTHQIHTDPTLVEPTGFYHRYNIMQVLAIMRYVKEGSAFVSTKGILMFNYRDVQISILPRVA